MATLIQDSQFAADRSLTADTGGNPTFTRASVVQYFTATGDDLAEVATNVAAFPYTQDGVTSLGLLVEDSVAEITKNNYFVDDNETNWTQFGAFSSSFVIVTASMLGVGTSVGRVIRIAGSGFEGTSQSFTGLSTSSNYELAIWQEGFNGPPGARIGLNGVTNFTPVTGPVRHVRSVTPASSSDSLDLYSNSGSIGEWYNISLIQSQNRDWLGSIILTTASATATRAAAVCTLATSGITGWDATKGSVEIVGRTAPGGGIIQVMWQVDNTNDTDVILLHRNASNEIHYIVLSGGTTQCDINLGTIADDTDFTVRARWEANDFQAALDGSLGTPDTSGTIPTHATNRLGRNNAGDEYWDGTIDTWRVWDDVLTNDELQNGPTAGGWLNRNYWWDNL